MSVSIAKWTLDEYHQMIEAGILDDRRVELLRGDIIEIPPETPSHAFISTEATSYLLNLLDEVADVRSGKPIALPNQSEPDPDLAIVQNLGREYRNRHPCPENIFWLIEYTDFNFSIDVGLKREIYAEVGILEYWIANLLNSQLTVLRDPKNGDYCSETIFTTGTIAPVAFPEIAISVDRILNG